MNNICKKALRTTLYIVLISLVLFLPAIVYKMYRTPAPIPCLETNWNGSETLGYYGSIIGAIATIYVLRKTIIFTQHSQAEERKHTTQPRLGATMSFCPFIKETVYNHPFFLNITTEDKQILMTPPKNFPDLHTLEMYSQVSTASEQASNTDGDNMMETQLNANKKKFLEQHYVATYEITNYGAGNAIDVEFLVDDCPVSGNICISTEESVRFLLIFQKSLLNSSGKDKEANIVLQYTNIFSSAKYRQKQQIKFTDKGIPYNASCQKPLTPPEEIQKNEE